MVFDVLAFFLAWLWMVSFDFVMDGYVDIHASLLFIYLAVSTENGLFILEENDRWKI